MSDKDRHAHHENILKEVTSMVATKCLNPKTKQSYHVDVIKQSMKDLNFSVDPNKSVKQQGLELIKQLQASGKLPIERAEIKMKLSFPVKGEKEGKKIKDKLSKITKRIDSEEYWNADTLEIVKIDFPIL
jgi:ribosome maturation protein SDO1